MLIIHFALETGYIKYRQGVANPCRLHLDFNSLITLFTYSLSRLEPVFYPATEHDTTLKYKILLLFYNKDVRNIEMLQSFFKNQFASIGSRKHLKLPNQPLHQFRKDILFLIRCFLHFSVIQLLVGYAGCGIGDQ